MGRTSEDGNDEEVASDPENKREDHHDGLFEVDVEIEREHGEELPDAEHQHAQQSACSQT